MSFPQYLYVPRLVPVAICPICQAFLATDPETTATTVCGHKFHSVCLNQTLQRNRNCVVCNCPQPVPKDLLPSPVQTSPGSNKNLPFPGYGYQNVPMIQSPPGAYTYCKAPPEGRVYGLTTQHQNPSAHQSIYPYPPTMGRRPEKNQQFFPPNFLPNQGSPVKPIASMAAPTVTTRPQAQITGFNFGSNLIRRIPVTRENKPLDVHPGSAFQSLKAPDHQDEVIVIEGKPEEPMVLDLTVKEERKEMVELDESSNESKINKSIERILAKSEDSHDLLYEEILGKLEDDAFLEYDDSSRQIMERPEPKTDIKSKLKLEIKTKMQKESEQSTNSQLSPLVPLVIDIPAPPQMPGGSQATDNSTDVTINRPSVIIDVHEGNSTDDAMDLSKSTQAETTDGRSRRKRGASLYNRKAPGLARNLRSAKLWELLLYMLGRPEDFGHVIQWKNKSIGFFKLMSDDMLLEIYNEYKARIPGRAPSLQKRILYSSITRALRHYYWNSTLHPTPKRKTYQFGANATGWQSGVSRIHALESLQEWDAVRKTGFPPGTTPPDRVSNTDAQQGRCSSSSEQDIYEIQPQGCDNEVSCSDSGSGILDLTT